MAATYSIRSGDPVAIAEKLLVVEERNAAPPPRDGEVGEVAAAAAAAFSATSSGRVCKRLGAKIVARLVASILLPGSAEPMKSNDQFHFHDPRYALYAYREIRKNTLTRLRDSPDS